jgi:HEAT repeat protein
MPNLKVLEAAAESRREARPEAQRVYDQHRDQISNLIRQLAGPTQTHRDQAYDLLSQMGDVVAPELFAALVDPTLDLDILEQVIFLLGFTGYERACEPLWDFFQAHQDDRERAATAALSLAGLGDDRALPFVRQMLNADDEEWVANAVAAMIAIGRPEDIPRLREIHRQHLTNDEIRFGIASAVLSILGETEQRTRERTLDDIEVSLADRHLWDDIRAILEEQFETKDITWH